MNDIAFPEKPLEDDVSGSELQNKFPESQTLKNFSTGTYWKRLSRYKKNLWRKSLFRERPYRPIYRAVKWKKNSQSRKYFVRKNFSTDTCRNGSIRLRKKLETESLFRKSPSRPIYRAMKWKKNSQSRKYFDRKNVLTGTCRRGPPRSEKELWTKSLF